jgi:hypothetical protein
MRLTALTNSPSAAPSAGIPCLSAHELYTQLGLSLSSARLGGLALGGLYPKTDSMLSLHQELQFQTVNV